MTHVILYMRLAHACPIGNHSDAKDLSRVWWTRVLVSTGARGRGGGISFWFATVCPPQWGRMKRITSELSTAHGGGSGLPSLLLLVPVGALREVNPMVLHRPCLGFDKARSRREQRLARDPGRKSHFSQSSRTLYQTRNRPPPSYLSQMFRV